MTGLPLKCGLIRTLGDSQQSLRPTSRSRACAKSLLDRRVALESAYVSRREDRRDRSVIDVDSAAAQNGVHAASGWQRYVRFIDNYKLQIFWVVLFHVVLLLIFAERAYCESLFSVS